jgi:hypothetical protein
MGLMKVEEPLWAVQRMFERGEDRFFLALKDDYRLIVDLDNTINQSHGEWYTNNNPLTLDKIKKPPKS